MSDNYYTATEAMRILGVSASRFYSLVRQGEIAKVSLPGDTRHFVYRKEDIDRIAEALSQVRAEPATSIEQLVLKAYENAELAYSRATGITLYLNLTREALPAHSPEIETLKAMIDSATQASNRLQALQFDISKLANQLKES